MGVHTLQEANMTADQRREVLVTELLISAFAELTQLGNKEYAAKLINRAVGFGASSALICAFNVAVAINHARCGCYKEAYCTLQSIDSATAKLYGFLLDGLSRELGLPLAYTPGDSFTATDERYWQTIGEATSAVLDADPDATADNILPAVACILTPQRESRSSGRTTVPA